jgi:MoaA/NifB/PqqE/SkfB family radical SAM enzyme
MGHTVIVWSVVETCPLECAFCGYSRQLARPRMSADLATLTAFGRVLCDVRTQSDRSILVCWLGGEPLSWPDLPAASRSFHRIFGLRLGATTSGIPLQSAGVRKLVLEEFEQLTISIDGLPAYHDRVRGKAGLFGRLRSIVKRLRREDVEGRLQRRVNTVLMRGNIAAFREFCEEMAEWGFHELTFNQLGGNDRPEFFAAHRLLPEQVERFAAELPSVRRQAAACGMEIRGSEWYLARIVASTNDQRIAIDDCRPGSNFLFISPQGRISPCSFSTSAYGIPLAEVRSVQDFLQLPLRFQEIRGRDRIPACNDCHATHVFDKFKNQSELPMAENQAST